jgi:iodotyrosine deiodinase
MEHDHGFIALSYTKPSPEELTDKAKSFRAMLDKRRTVRHFSNQPVQEEVIKDLLMTAASAPSGANKQPWIFCAISNPDIKSQIRKAAEIEEYQNYHGRMSDTWKEDLKPLGTDWNKEFLEIAPWIIVVLRKPYDINPSGQTEKNYYVNESVGIACGMLIAAIQQAGLVCLTHTPSPMEFLTKILGRPANEKPYLLIPVGYPANDAFVPLIQRKDEADVLKWYR